MSKDIRENNERANQRNLLEAKINDRYKFAISKNKITYTDFLNLSEKNIAEKYLKENHINNYIFFGGNEENSDRNILIFYPEKFSIDMVYKNISKILAVIKIEFPKELEYEHKVFLSGIMKLGIKREKVGDILITKNGAEIIVLNELAEFLKDGMQELTRFKSAKFFIIDIKDLQQKVQEFEESSIIVSSMRLDNFVAELSHCSRAKAEEILKMQKVFINYNLEIKDSKKIQKGDIINIRGKGKFIVGEIIKTTKSDKLVVNMKKYK